MFDNVSVSDADYATAPGAKPADQTHRERLDAWLALAGGGDQRAFRRLYDASSSKLLAHALSMLRRRDAAEDALQDAYVKIWVRASDYDPARGHAMAWMVRVLRNVIIDRMRRERLMARYHVAEDCAPDMPVAPDPVEDRIDLVSGLATLTDDQRKAIVNVVVRGWTHEEAGRHEGVPTPTSKARALRGLKRLRALYENDLLPIEQIGQHAGK